MVPPEHCTPPQMFILGLCQKDRAALAEHYSTAFNPSTWEEEDGRCEFGAILVYTVSSSPAKVHSGTMSQKKKDKVTKSKCLGSVIVFFCEHFKV